MLAVSSDAASASEALVSVPVDRSVVVVPAIVTTAPVAPVTSGEIDVPPPPGSGNGRGNGKGSCALAGPGPAANTVSPTTSATMPNRTYLVVLITSLLSSGSALRVFRYNF